MMIWCVWVSEDNVQDKMVERKTKRLKWSIIEYIFRVCDRAFSSVRDVTILLTLYFE